MNRVSIKAWFALLRAQREVKRLSFGKEAFARRTYSYRFDNFPRRVPKTVWMYWDKGEAAAPDFVRYCIETWRRHNPQWSVVVLDKNAARRHLPDDVMPKDISVQAYSDLLRLRLVHDHGGVWVDASTACLRPLDDWLPMLMQSGFFVFANDQPMRLISSWFIASERKGEAIGIWRQAAEDYWRTATRPDHYFWVHILFGYKVRTDRRLRDAWRRTPKVSADSARILKRLLTQRRYFERAPEDIDLEAIPFLKLSSGGRLESSVVNEAVRTGADIDLRAVIDELADVASIGGN